MNIILKDFNSDNLLPFTFTRPVAGIRVGILTIAEKWERYLKATVSYQTKDYLAAKFSLKVGENNLVVNGGILPTAVLVNQLLALQSNEVLVKNSLVIGYVTNDPLKDFSVADLNVIESNAEFISITTTWDIFSKNAEALQQDFDLLTKDRKSQPIPSNNTVINPENVFLEEGAQVSCSILNASTGPIYVGKNAEIMEGCIIRGGLALCDNAVLKMGAKIYGAATFGPFCKVGGEVNNAVLFAYSNKGHEGFLGNSVLGEWCNLGADTNTSNLKNNYAPVKLWDYKKEGFVQTGLQFCGLMMGDHSKAGINTMFNTGTVVGVSANVFGTGFPRNFVPSYSWGGASGFTTYRTNKAFETAKAMMGRRGVEFDQIEQDILETVFELTQKWRKS
ncbi:glucose-1-phosphate thymidylyltransferase [Croceivirga lutea]|uniref:GlmU family protein n=1 Tax=Croceivirga lutea TaxID=1775167 RepID=UPI0016395205|nr:GlmU family protein [Croceivirga lutea]GGG47612.1 glucose-1-phosphate thymidylyltransferase [Croceivirga lutea]